MLQSFKLLNFIKMFGLISDQRHVITHISGWKLLHAWYVQFPGDFNSTGKSQVVANKLTWTQAQLMYMGDHLNSELREKIQEREREGGRERENYFQ